MTPREKAERRQFIPLDDEELAEAERASKELHSWMAGRRVRWAIGTVAVVVLGTVLAVLSTGVVRNVNRLDSLQRADASGARSAEYQGCVRQDVNRLEWQTARGSAARARQRRTPVLDCSPVLKQRGAQPRPLGVREQRRATRFYRQTYRVPIIRGGRVRLCPDVRDAQASVTRWNRVPRRCLTTGDIGR